MPEPIAQPYARYAPVYDATGQTEPGRAMAGAALHYAAATGTPVHRALDLACGTGAVLADWQAAGLEVVGIDRSPAMLAIAARRLADTHPAASLIQTDMRRLDEALPAGALFDLVTCLSGSVQELPEPDDLALLCSQVAPYLRPGGLLVFDLYSEAALAAWDEHDQVVYDGRDYLVYQRWRYDRPRRVASRRVVWFVREIERWWRDEELLPMRAWSDDEVLQALARAGLQIEARLAPAGQPADAAATQVAYVARR